MKLIFITITMLISFFIKGQSLKLEIPNKVSVEYSLEHIPILYTRLSIIPPDNFSIKEGQDAVWIKKDRNTFIKIKEYRLKSYYTEKNEILGKIQDINNQIKKPYFYKEFKLGNFDAFIISGISQIADREYVQLIIGNSNFYVLLDCAFPSNEKETRNNIIKSLLTSYVDETSFVKLKNYVIDYKKSNYKYSRTSGLSDIYTENGIIPTKDIMNSFIIMTFPPFNTIEQQYEFSKSMISKKVLISNIEEKSIKLNNYSAIEYIFEGKQQDVLLKGYHVIISNNEKAIVFYGVAISDIENNLNEYKDIVKTLKIK